MWEMGLTGSRQLRHIGHTALLLLLTLAGCVTQQGSPVDISLQQLAEYEALLKNTDERERQALATVASGEGERYARVDEQTFRELIVKYDLDPQKETTAFQTDASNADVMDTMGVWYNDVRSNLQKTFGGKKGVKVSVRPRPTRKLSLADWKIKVLRLLKHPLEITVSGNKIKARYKIPWGPSR